MKALGIAAKFGNGFVNQGGSLEMMSWLADDPELLCQVVQIADQKLLVKGSAGTVKWKGGFAIDPGNFIPSAALVAEAEEKEIISINPRERKVIYQTSLTSYVLRKRARRHDIWREMERLKINEELDVGDLWGALVGFRTSVFKGILDWHGGINEFCIPRIIQNRILYWPVRAVYVAGKGWKIAFLEKLNTFGDEFLEAGTHFIVRGMS